MHLNIMKGGFTMLDSTLSFAAIVIISIITALALVKLYRHGVKKWMVHTAIVLVGLLYFIFRPFEITKAALSVYLIVVIISVFVTEKPSSENSYSEDKPKKERQHSGSLTDNLTDFFLIYAIFDYFDDTDDW